MYSYNILVLDFLCVDIEVLFNLLILGSSLDTRLFGKLSRLVLLLLLRIGFSSFIKSGKKSSSVTNGSIFGWVHSLSEIVRLFTSPKSGTVYKELYRIIHENNS